MPEVKLDGHTATWASEGIAAARVEPWVRASLEAARRWFGSLPEDVSIRLVGEPGAGVRFGLAEWAQPPQVTVWVGTRASAATLRDDWVLTHELLHTGFPLMPERSAWLTEGLATYAEPLARARAGTRDLHQAWSALRNSLPQGEAAPGDGGLDGTTSWARRYWGGALWCFAADVSLREQTKGKLGLDAAQGLLAKSGATLREGWSAVRAVRALDNLTGTDVFSTLHDLHVDNARFFGVPGLVKRAAAVGLIPTA